jgi:hypothetical protein
VFTLGTEDAYGQTQIETAGQCVDLPDTIQWARWWLLEPHTHRGRDMSVARNPWIEAAVHGMEAHMIANKKKFKQIISTRKIMCTVFWDRKSVLLVEFLPQGSTINTGVYCNTLK